MKVNEQATSKENTVGHDTIKFNEQAPSKVNRVSHDTITSYLVLLKVITHDTFII